MLTEQQIASARSIDIGALIGKSVKLRKSGRDLSACCPFHKESTPSFFVVPNKGFAHCFGCGWNGDPIRWAMDYFNLAFSDAVKHLVGHEGMPEAPIQRASIGSHEPDCVESGVVAQYIMETAAPMLRSPAEGYLESRRIPIARTQHYLTNMMFHPAAPTRTWDIGKDHQSVSHCPAMVAPISNPETGEWIGAHVTYLTPDGCNKTKRKIYGHCQGGAVILNAGPPRWPLLVGEGLESTLAGLLIMLSNGAGFRLAATLSLNNHQGYPVIGRDGVLDLWAVQYDRSKRSFAVSNPGTVFGLVDNDMKPHKVKNRKMRGGPVDDTIWQDERTTICAELLKQKWVGFGAKSFHPLIPPDNSDHNDMIIEFGI